MVNSILSTSNSLTGRIFQLSLLFARAQYYKIDIVHLVQNLSHGSGQLLNKYFPDLFHSSDRNRVNYPSRFELSENLNSHNEAACKRNSELFSKVDPKDSLPGTLHRVKSSHNLYNNSETVPYPNLFVERFICNIEYFFKQHLIEVSEV